MTGQGEDIGLAVIGCGPIGRVRAELARDYPGVGWLGVCDIRQDLADDLGRDTGADFVGTDAAELLARPEVNAVIVATQESAHTVPVMQAVEHGHRLFIEKPLAMDVRESEQVARAITAAKVDAVMGYTQRFRRRFLTVKERLMKGQIGAVTAVSARALLNRKIAEMCLSRANQHDTATPVVVSGTHVLDMCLWLLEGDSRFRSLPNPPTMCSGQPVARIQPSPLSSSMTAACFRSTIAGRPLWSGRVLSTVCRSGSSATAA